MQKHKLYLSVLLVPVFIISAMSNRSYGQAMQGHIRYLVTHNWAKKMAAVEYLSKQQRDRVTYMWGSRAEWKEYTEMYYKPGHTMYFDSEERAEPDDQGYSWRNDIYTIRRNLDENTILDNIQILGKIYVIEDTLRPQNWKILNDIKEVAGHICMNAFWRDTLKHQDVVAWFAMDIPVSGGPERFFGLPGMILEVDVNNGAMVITADKMDENPITTQMDLPKKMKGKHIKEADYLRILKQHMDDRKAAEEPPFWGIRY